VPVNNGFHHTDALADGLADAATLAFANFELVDARLRGLDVGLFTLQDWGVPDFCQLIFIALPETVDARAAELRAFLRVVRCGIDFVAAQPAEAKAIFTRRTAPSAAAAELSSATHDATVPCFRADMSLDDEYYERLGDWLVSTGQTHGAALPPVRSYWTNALLTDAA
jgi:ABC-type nitrate/sulfonate/bicarbonate transport system substrate-binding protein